MADPLTKDELVRVSAIWAKDATLDEISGRIGGTNEILTRIGKVFGKRFDATGLNLEFKKTGQHVKMAGTDANQTAISFRKARKGLGDFDSSVSDLRHSLLLYGNSLQDYKRSIGELVTGSKDATKMLPGMARDVSQAFATMIQRLPALSRLIAGVGVAAGFAIQRYLESADVYRDMMQSGALFSGSIEGFVKIVRANGVSLTAAQQVINKQTQAILITGETRFFATVGRMGNTLDKFGLKMDQGAELLGELFEIQRLTGNLYGRSQEELVDSNTRLLTLLNAQARLTGISVRRQTEEARRIAEDERVRILAQSLPQQMQEAITTFSASLSAANIPTDVASELVRELVTGAPGRGSAALRVFAPYQVEDLFAAARTGDQLRINEAIQQMARAAAEIPIEQRAGISYMQAPEIRRLIVALTDRFLVAARPITDVDGKTPQQIFQETLQGFSVIGTSTENLFGAQGRITRAFGTFESRLITVASEGGAIDLFTTSLNAAARGLEAASNASSAVVMALAGSLAALTAVNLGRDIAGVITDRRAPSGRSTTPTTPPGGAPRGRTATTLRRGAAGAAAMAALYALGHSVGLSSEQIESIGPPHQMITTWLSSILPGGTSATTPTAEQTRPVRIREPTREQIEQMRSRVTALAAVDVGEAQQTVSGQLAELVERERNLMALVERVATQPNLLPALEEQTRIIETALRTLTRATINNQ
jgi:hypothetical protein